MTYVKVNDVLYPATISGRMSDKEWDGRASKSIKLEMSYDDAVTNFADGVVWSIVQETVTPEPQYDEEGNIVVDEDGNPVTTNSVTTDEFDNSDYNLAGDVTDHRDGYVTVKMGKLTDLEEAYEIMLGGVG